MAKVYGEIEAWNAENKLEPMSCAFQGLRGLAWCPECGTQKLDKAFEHISKRLMELCHHPTVEGLEEMDDLLEDLASLADPGVHMDLGMKNSEGLYHLFHFFSIILGEIILDLKASQGPDNGEPGEAPGAAPGSAQEEEGAEA